MAKDKALYRLTPDERRVIGEQLARVATAQADLRAQIEFITRRERLNNLLFDPTQMAFFPLKDVETKKVD